jgi:hypothetical protein
MLTLEKTSPKLGRMIPKFGSYDGYPTRFTDTEAWTLYDGQQWQREDIFDIHTKAAVLTEQDYADTFGELPPVPKAAFHPGE